MPYPFYELMINGCDTSWGWNGFNWNNTKESPKKANRIEKSWDTEATKHAHIRSRSSTSPIQVNGKRSSHHLHSLRHRFLYLLIYLFLFMCMLLFLFHLQDDLTGQAILDVVFARLNLIETAYFGLRFLDEENQTVSDSLFTNDLSSWFYFPSRSFFYFGIFPNFLIISNEILMNWWDGWIHFQKRHFFSGKLIKLNFRKPFLGNLFSLIPLRIYLNFVK